MFLSELTVRVKTFYHTYERSSSTACLIAVSLWLFALTSCEGVAMSIVYVTSGVKSYQGQNMILTLCTMASSWSALVFGSRRFESMRCTRRGTTLAPIFSTRI
jgi:hypothetical protein